MCVWFVLQQLQQHRSDSVGEMRGRDIICRRPALMHAHSVDSHSPVRVSSPSIEKNSNNSGINSPSRSRRNPPPPVADLSSYRWCETN